MIKNMTEKKEPLMCYFHFMFNAWNEAMAKKVFATASCGWQYLWDKWNICCRLNGYTGAITMYYVEYLDDELRNTLADAAYDYYNGE